METKERNKLCSCGSQKKYNFCCLEKERILLPIDLDKKWLSIRTCEASILGILKCYVEKELDPGVKKAAQEVFSIFSDFDVDFDLYQGIFDYWFLFNWQIETEALPQLTDSYKGITIAELCLIDHPELFDLHQTKLIFAICASPFSFYLVKDVIPERRLILKDILLNKETTVKECQGTRGVKKGTIFFCRLVTLNDQSIILGFAPYAIPNHYFSDILNFRHQLKRETHPLLFGSHLLLDLDFELRDHYFQLIERSHQSVDFSRTDREPIVLHEVEYELKCPPLIAIRKLYELSSEKNLGKLLSRAEYDSEGQFETLSFSWGKPDTLLNSRSLAMLTITSSTLKTFANSRECAEAICREIENLLGSLVNYKTTQVTHSDLFKNIATENNNLMQNLEALKYLKDHIKEYWKRWLDFSIPALGNITPREAAKTSDGREQLEALFLDFEANNEIAIKNNGEHMLVDVDALKKELAL